MISLRNLIAGFRSLFHKSQTSADLDEELRAYLDAAIASFCSAGVSPAVLVRIVTRRTQ